MPADTAGKDPSGFVSVVLDQDGVKKAFHVTQKGK
jgi:hypothetical protein